ncbi:Serine/threonine-protein kinase Nek1, partial [Varanus komodoensis]
MCRFNMEILYFTAEVPKEELVVKTNGEMRAATPVGEESSGEIDSTEKITPEKLSAPKFIQLLPKPDLINEPEDLETELLEETKENKCKTNEFPVTTDVWIKEGKVKEP